MSNKAYEDENVSRDDETECNDSRRILLFSDFLLYFFNQRSFLNGLKTKKYSNQQVVFFNNKKVQLSGAWLSLLVKFDKPKLINIRINAPALVCEIFREKLL